MHYIFDGYVQLPGLEVWFQRASDVVRKLRSGDVDLGIVGYDMVCEYGEVGYFIFPLYFNSLFSISKWKLYYFVSTDQGHEDLIIVHDALAFGKCHLAICVSVDFCFQ